jgi:hypothetical protein
VVTVKDFRWELLFLRPAFVLAFVVRGAYEGCRELQATQEGAQEIVTLCTEHGWFAKGFDTTDLQEAKALLEEMA